MAYEPKPGTFALFKNDKGDNPKRPDYRGDGLDLEGNEIEVSAWLKEGKNGKFLSCNFKPRSGQSKAKPKPGSDESDIPFAPIGRRESLIA